MADWWLWLNMSSMWIWTDLRLKRHLWQARSFRSTEHDLRTWAFRYCCLVPHTKVFSLHFCGDLYQVEFKSQTRSEASQGKTQWASQPSKSSYQSAIGLKRRSPPRKMWISRHCPETRLATTSLVFLFDIYVRYLWLGFVFESYAWDLCLILHVRLH